MILYFNACPQHRRHARPGTQTGQTKQSCGGVQPFAQAHSLQSGLYFDEPSSVLLIITTFVIASLNHFLNQRDGCRRVRSPLITTTKKIKVVCGETKEKSFKQRGIKSD